MQLLLQPGRQEHPVHHQPLPERPVGKQRHQEPLCRENQQSGGNLRKTSSTGYEPKELARISGSSLGDIYQLYDVQREFGEQDQQALITEEGIWTNWDTKLTRSRDG